MGLDDFWNATFRSVLNVIEGRREMHEAQDRAEWERVRWLATIGLQPHLKKGSKMKPTDLVEFSWEKKPPKDPETEAKKAARLERFRKWDEQMKKKHNGE
jgi:hypothetical protein